MPIYIVRPGDSLYAIARRYGTTFDILAYKNQLSDPARLVPGMALIVPGAETARQELEANAYAYPSISPAVLRETLPYLSWLCPFCCRAGENGELYTIDDETVIALSREYSAAPLLTVTNIDDSGSFSGRVAHSIFTDPAARAALLGNILEAVDVRSMYGVNLNFEYINPADKDGYNDFLAECSELLHARGCFLSTAIAPKESDSQQGVLYAAHDYAAHGKYCDRVVLMTYEWGYTYSAPQAVSPVNRMRQVLDYAVTRIPPGKILLGMSNYGYDWALPWQQGEAASVVSNVSAMNRAAALGSEIFFDSTAMAPYYSYRAQDGRVHRVWFEDVRSVEARLQLVKDYYLAGISWWTVNFLNRPAFSVLSERFSVEKVV